MDSLRDHIRVVAESELFDGGWYVLRHPDVSILGMPAAEHYLRIGAALGRDPGPSFSTGSYLHDNVDVAANGINPLVHYERYGRVEQRRILPSEADPEAGPAPGAVIGADDPEDVRDAFDEAFYLESNPDVALSGEDPFLHYITIGWRLGRDPSPTFSTLHYLDNAPDLRRAGVNPFVHYVRHGRHEKRSAQPHRRLLSQMSYEPTVTAIVPNYNHARFLPHRIDSILGQTYPHVEILLLDDCSTDESREVIADYCERFPGRVRAILNDTNSGNVFRQWHRGVEQATGDLVWICESDDFCEPDFLSWLVPHFRDRSVEIAFGRIQFATPDGDFQSGLDNYREGAEEGIWSAPVVRPAARWFARGFGVNNVIANVGGSLWRRQSLAPQVWEEARTYSILGDWFLYLHLAGGGQIAYDPSAVAYFRQHGDNTSVTSFKGTRYYEEHARFGSLLRRRWPVPAKTVDRFVDKVAFQYRHFGLEAEHGPLERYLDAESLKEIDRSAPHVLIAFLGFHAGGGEMFPIALANALRDAGWLVSMLAYDMTEINDGMAATLDPGIPVYSATAVAEVGVGRFLRQAGVSLIHSHMINLDHFLLERHRVPSTVPYVVSLHGSYEGSNIARDRVERLVARVDHWVYTADKNLAPFAGLQDHGRFSKIPNGMPADPRDLPKTRDDLGITGDAVVFAFVARGVEGKGWHEAATAFVRLRDRVEDQRLHLLMCGTGPETDRAQAAWGDDPDITFLGYQPEINGLYRLSDCALVPTRFTGESFPLCIIQALQERLPVIATDIGEITDMITGAGGSVAGRLIDYDEDDATYVDTVVDAMRDMLDPTQRASAADVADELRDRFDIAAVAARYAELYRELLDAQRA